MLLATEEIKYLMNKASWVTFCSRCLFPGRHNDSTSWFSMFDGAESLELELEMLFKVQRMLPMNVQQNASTYVSK